MLETEQRLKELVKEKLGMALVIRRELAKLPALLGDDEDVLNLARGKCDGMEGLVVVTDRRILFVGEAMMRSHLEDFSYEKVSSVKTETGLGCGKITVYAGGSAAELENIRPKRRTAEIGEYVRARIGSKLEAVAPGAIGPEYDGPLEQLEKLGALHSSWILTTEEFEAKKTEVLARM